MIIKRDANKTCILHEEVKAAFTNMHVCLFKAYGSKQTMNLCNQLVQSPKRVFVVCCGVALI